MGRPRPHVQRHQVREITEKVATSIPGVVADLEELVAIPSVSFPAYPSESMEAMAQRTLQMLCAAGFAPAVGPHPKGHAMSEETTHTTEAVGDGGTTLFVADFNDTETAWEAYEALTSVEDGRHVKISGVIVVKRGDDGEIDVQRATDHSTRRGLTWGLVGGATLGLLFPPTLIGSAVVLGGAGAALGKARHLHRKSELTDRLEYALAPGHSGIVAIVSDSAVPEIRATLASANAIVESALDDVVAKDIKALAKEAEKE